VIGYSSKAEKYAKYRWGYAAQAIQTIFDVTGISSQSCVADIGAGTGILTGHTDFFLYGTRNFERFHRVIIFDFLCTG
jgi:hypothetical protein